MKAAALTAAVVMTALAFPMSARAGHWCRHGDPPAYVSDRTSCPFAGRVVSKYIARFYPARHGVMYVRSPVTHKTYRLTFRRRGTRVTVRGPNEIRVRFTYYGG
jgi:hypothetical protein